MKAKVKIRQARPDDAERLQCFIAGVVDEHLPVLFYRDQGPSLDDMKGLIDEGCSKQNSAIFVADDGTDIVGMLDFHGAAHLQQRHSGSFGMSVGKSHRGKGIGKSLIAALCEWAPKNGVSRLELEVFENNVAAIRLYRRLGFEVEGVRRAAVVVGTMPIGIMMMAKPLPRALSSKGTV